MFPCKFITATFASLLIAAASSRGAQRVFYDVTFSSPPHTLWTLPAAGSTTFPSDRVSRVNFGHPTVVPAFGALVDQPLELRGAGETQPAYSQIEFSVGNQRDFVIFETDFLIRSNSLTGQSSLTFLFDTPQVRTVSFRSDGTVGSYIPGLPNRVHGLYFFDRKNRFRAELNLGAHTWRLFLNGVLLESGNFDAEQLNTIRVNLQHAASQNPAAGLDNVLVTVYDGAPYIIEPPRSQTKAEGDAVTFEVVATGENTRVNGLPRYQWLFNGQAISGATSAKYVLSGLRPSDAGEYSVRVVNGYGSTFSAPATLTIDGSPARLLNISTRLDVQNGDRVLIGGFIIQGSQAKRVILRAIGPSLNNNGAPIPGRLADPALQLHNSTGAMIATNDNWRDTQEQEIIASTVPPPDPKESAIVALLQPGAYTAIIRGANDSSGVGLVEVYSLDERPLSKIMNVSTRGYVQTGDKVMIGGVILGGTKPARLLVRAIGPSLNINGTPLEGTLQNSALEIRNGQGVLVATNDDWGSHQREEIEATGVPPGDEREAAVIALLEAGNYTAIVRSADGGSGLASVEVYVLDR